MKTKYTRKHATADRLLRFFWPPAFLGTFWTSADCRGVYRGCDARNFSILLTPAGFPRQHVRKHDVSRWTCNVGSILIRSFPCDIFVAGRHGYTTLHAAAADDQEGQELLDLLLSARSTQAMTAALTTPASGGASPLSVTAEHGHSTAVSSLLVAGAKHEA